MWFPSTWLLMPPILAVTQISAAFVVASSDGSMVMHAGPSGSAQHLIIIRVCGLTTRGVNVTQQQSHDIQTLAFQSLLVTQIPTDSPLVQQPPPAWPCSHALHILASKPLLHTVLWSFAPQRTHTHQSCCRSRPRQGWCQPAASPSRGPHHPGRPPPGTRVCARHPRLGPRRLPGRGRAARHSPRHAGGGSGLKQQGGGDNHCHNTV